MSHSYDRYESRQRHSSGASSRRTTFGYWIPLAFTVTVATAGLVAWIWKERKDSHHRDGEGKDSGPPPPQQPPPPGYGPPGSGGPPPPGMDPSQAYPPPPSGMQPPPGPQELSQGVRQQGDQSADVSVMGRVQGALRRTPSPQQLFDSASRQVAAGVAAAGAAVGGALASIREEDKAEYGDHARWSEEAATRAGSGGQTAYGSSQAPVSQRTVSKRRTVAIVISADVAHDAMGSEPAAYHEHASLLSHLPEHVSDDSRVIVMIYAPDLKQHPLSQENQSGRQPPSMDSSYSNIEREETDRPLEQVDPRPVSYSGSGIFDTLYKQAQALVDNKTMIMPFSTPSGYVQILRHVSPEVVYVQDTLSGPAGETVKSITGFVGQVVLVVGDESGHGGIVDSDDDRAAAGDEKGEKWWSNDPRVGLGKGLEVVEGLRLGEDWRRRVRGHD